jgi:hypothetical protein
MNIDKHIPEPLPRTLTAGPADPTNRAPLGERKSELESLLVGYSFAIHDLTQQQAFQRYYNPAKRLGIKITIRNMGDHVRLWRTQ